MRTRGMEVAALTPVSRLLLPWMGSVEMSLTEDAIESAGDGLLSRSGTLRYAVSERRRSSISMNCGRRGRSTFADDVSLVSHGRGAEDGLLDPVLEALTESG